MNGLPIENLSSEHAFLIGIVRSAINGNCSVVPNESVDWAVVAEEAAYHGVVPQLWQFLQQFNSDALPSDVRESLQRSFQNNLKHNLMLTGELWQILVMLNAQGISAIPFKGPTLAMLAYGDLAQREFSDLDILVDEHDLVKVGELLASAGYQSRMDLSLLNDSVFTGIEREFYFTNARTDTLIDLQWRLSSSILPFDLGREHIRQNQIIAFPGGKPIATLGLEDLLLYLCVHGSRHCWERLGWIADVGGLINLNPQLNWDLLVSQACALKCERVLYHSLLLAQWLTGAPIPPRIERMACADDSSQALANKIVQNLFQPMGSSRSKFELHRYFLKLQHQRTDQFRHLVRLIFEPTIIDWQFWPLPNTLTFLYPIVRMIRLITESFSLHRPHKASN